MTLAVLCASSLSTTTTSGARTPRRLGAAVDPIRLIPTGGDPMQVAELGHSYHGTLGLTAASDGLVLTDRLSLERYLLGLNEVPTDWPFEALKAQAVAARTYALHVLAKGRAGEGAVYGFDICASVQCQVYTGADVTAGLTGARWARAVAETRGESVLYDGLPILARYHSTSGGRTLDNPQAFPTEGAYPYLRGVTSTTERGSPLYRWLATFPVKHMRAILERAGWWPGDGGPIRRVRSVASAAGFHYPDVIVSGRELTVRRTAEEWRDVLRDVAPDLYPGRYPGPSTTASGRLPETLPSNRITVWTRRKVVRVLGRGWGHGVGMSQWGAHGLALRGASYTDILNHYYTDVAVGPGPDPGAIEVGLAWQQNALTISGAFRVVDGNGETLVDDALGTWRFRPQGPGAIGIDPPAGFGLPLRVGLVNAPRRVLMGGSAYFTIALSKPARVKTVTRGRGETFAIPFLDVGKAGRTRIAWSAPNEPGRYEVTLVGEAGRARRRSETVTVVVERPPPSAAADDDGLDKTGDAGEGSVPLGVVMVALVLLLAFGVTRRVSKVRSRSPGPR